MPLSKRVAGYKDPQRGAQSTDGLPLEALQSALAMTIVVAE